MPYSDGVFTRLYNWQTERNAGNDIDATKMDADTDGIATGLSTAICRDGQSTIISNIGFSGNKITGLGNGTAPQDAMNQASSDDRYIQQVGGEITPANSVSNVIDLSTGRDFYSTTTGAVSWTFSNPAAAGGLDGFLLELTNGGSAVQTWPTSVRWPNGTVPTLTTAGTDLLAFVTRDGGLTWRGQLCQRNSS